MKCRFKQVIWNIVVTDACQSEISLLLTLANSILVSISDFLGPLMPELNPSAQHCLTQIFTEDFASWTVQFVNIRVKNQ
jgi:hypothetical protein